MYIYDYVQVCLDNSDLYNSGSAVTRINSLCSNESRLLGHVRPRHSAKKLLKLRVRREFGQNSYYVCDRCFTSELGRIRFRLLSI